MYDYSRLEGSVPVSPTPGSVRRVRKKGKTGDRNRQRGKRHPKGKAGKAEEDVLEISTAREQGNKDEGPKPDVEEEAGHGLNGSKKRPRRKIDLVI